MTAEVEFEALGLLDGLDGKARQERVDLLSWLLEQGFSLDQIRSSVTPVLLPANRVLGDDGEYVSAREVCEKTGVDLDILQRLQRAVGLPRIDDPDAAVLSRVDGEAVAQAKFFVDLGIEDKHMIEAVRLMYEGLARAADVMRLGAYSAILRPGATERELAQASEALAQQARPHIGKMIEDLMLLVLRHGFETDTVNAAERAAGALPGARDVAVAFADLVGFTSLGEKLPPEQLEDVASRLGDLARDVVDAPVRFVKTIGDAVMFVSTDPVALLTTVLDLMDAAHDDDDFPRLRAGVAFGSAVSRGGDWFGSPVNVASRVTGVARPESVLVSGRAREAIGDADGFVWSYAGARHLRGVQGDVKLYRARRETDEPEDSNAPGLATIHPLRARRPD